MEHVNTQLTVRTTKLSYISIVISLSALGTGEFSGPLPPPPPQLTLSLTTTSCKINNKKSYSTKAFGSYDEWFGSTSWFWYWGWPHKKRRQGGMEWSGGLGWDTVILSYSQPTLTTRLLPFCLLIYTINHTTLPPVQPHPMPWTPYIFSKAGI